MVTDGITNVCVGAAARVAVAVGTEGTDRHRVLASEGHEELPGIEVLGGDVVDAVDLGAEFFAEGVERGAVFDAVGF